MESIIQARYTNFSMDDQDYPNTSVIAKFGQMPKPKPTIASESVSLAREKAKQKVSSTF